MFSHTFESVRVTDIPLDADEGVLTQLVHDITMPESSHGRGKLKSLLGRQPIGDSTQPIMSLAPQLRHKTGTITFPSRELKNQALDYKGEHPFSIDDTFIGNTVLYSGADPNLE